MATSTNLSAKDKMEMAYFSLLENKPYNEITVSQLIKSADVSRTTFYRHYVDIFDMYEKVSVHIVEAFLEKFFFVSKDATNDPMSILASFATAFATQEKYIRLLCGSNGGRPFFDYAIAIIIENMDKFYFLNENISTDDIFYIKFTASSAISTYVLSVSKNKNCINELYEMCKIAVDFIFSKKGDKNG